MKFPSGDQRPESSKSELDVTAYYFDRDDALQYRCTFELYSPDTATDERQFLRKVKVPY